MHIIPTRLALALVLFAAIAGPAAAEDGMWTGFYMGVQGGSISGSAHGSLSHNDPTTPGITAADIFASTARVFGMSGPAGGIQMGYNYHTGLLVYGIEADMAWVGATGATSAVSIDTTTTWHIDSKLYSLGTLRGRAGVAAGPVLLYGTAGFAWGRVETDNHVSCAGCSQDPWSQGISKADHLGVVGGGGAEWLIGSIVTLKAEYLFADLGSAKHAFQGTSASGSVETTPGSGVFVYDWDGFKHDLQFQMWRVGVNVKFF